MKQRLLISWVCIWLVRGSGVNAAEFTGLPEVFHPEPFNLARAVGNSDVLLVADDHTQSEIKDFLGENLPALQALGFRSLGLEMLPTHCQKDLDSWDPAARQRIQRHLEEFWGEKGAAIPASIYRLLEEAKREGFTVIAVDSDVPSGADRRSVNPYWVESIERCRRSSRDGSRMIVFGGASHFRGDSGTVLSLLKDRGVRASVLEFSGLESAESIDLEWRTAEALGRAVPGVLQIARENDRLGRHGVFMVSETTEWVINLEHHTEVALLASYK